jgi:DNA-binding CsgD family transcriptional regulator
VTLKGKRQRSSKDPAQTADPKPHLQRAYDRAQRRRSAAVHITDRQNQMMALLAQGCTDQHIARRLAMSPAPARNHLENVYARLGGASRVASVMQPNNTSST